MGVSSRRDSRINLRTCLGCWSVMAWLSNQNLSALGLCLKVVSGIERNSNLMVMPLPICIVSMPINSTFVDGPIILNHFLFHKVASIKLSIVEPVTGESPKLQV